jgi:deazaflavin-dependent oxidoreductase (nitroreductase family)
VTEATVRLTTGRHLVFLQLATIVGGIVLVLGLLAGAFFFGMRAKNPVVLGVVIGLSKALMNKSQMRTAGTPGAYAGIIRTVGRVSGRGYQTPVSPVPTDDGFVIALPYGTRANWLRNVLASGHATLVTEGETWEVDRPELVPMRGVEQWFPPADVRAHRMMRVDDALRLHRVRIAQADAA